MVCGPAEQSVKDVPVQKASIAVPPRSWDIIYVGG